MDSNTISVIIPTFNRENTITYCVNSILNQTHPADEIIIIDDLSTDETLEKVKLLNSDKIRIIRLSQKGGAQVARNEGIKAARGRWITFLDSDDAWVPEKLSRQFQILRENNFDESIMLYSNCYRYYPENGKREIWELPTFEGDKTFSLLLQEPGPMFQGLLVSKTKLIEAGLLDEKSISYQEWDTSINLSRICRLIHLKEPLFDYYFHTGDTISKDKSRDIAGYRQIVNKNRNNFDLFPELNIYQHHMKVLFQKAIYYKMWTEASEFLSEISKSDKNFKLYKKMFVEKRLISDKSLLVRFLSKCRRLLQ